MTDIVHTPHLFKELPTYERQGWGILNKFKRLWTDTIFSTPEEARAYIRLHVRPGVIEDYTFVKVVRMTTVVADNAEYGVSVARAAIKVPAHV